LLLKNRTGKSEGNAKYGMKNFVTFFRNPRLTVYDKTNQHETSFDVICLCLFKQARTNMQRGERDKKATRGKSNQKTKKGHLQQAGSFHHHY
jgi:hypothetical protein